MSKLLFKFAGRMAKTPDYTLSILKNVLPGCSLEEVRKMSLFIREQSDLYSKNELTEILIMISDRMIELYPRE